MAFRLSLMMFVQYTVLGATLPIISLYLRDNLGFNGARTGAVIGMSAVAASLSPLVTALLADRAASAERLLSICHVLAAAFVLALFPQRSFVPVLVLYLLFMVALRPSLGLTNAVVFHHVPGDRARFAAIRVWGTVGWIAVSLAFSYLWLGSAPPGGPSRLPHALLVSAGCSLVMAVYCLTLPAANLAHRSRPSVLPREALTLLRRRDIAVLACVNFLMFVVYQYYYVGAAPYLKAVGIAEHHIMPAMTLGQVSEVAMMWTVAWATRRLGYRRMFAVGIGAEIFRFALFTYGDSTAATLLGLTGHGFSIAYFMTGSLMYLDGHSTPASRSGAQLLFMIIAFGLAALAGSYLAGWTMDGATGTGGETDYRVFWSVPMWLSVAGMTVFLVWFRSNQIGHST